MDKLAKLHDYGLQISFKNAVISREYLVLADVELHRGMLRQKDPEEKWLLLEQSNGTLLLVKNARITLLIPGDRRVMPVEQKLITYSTKEMYDTALFLLGASQCKLNQLAGGMVEFVGCKKHPEKFFTRQTVIKKGQRPTGVFLLEYHAEHAKRLLRSAGKLCTLACS